MKCFSLLFEKEVHLNPDTKVLPAKEFSTLQKASEIVKEAKLQAKQLEKQTQEEAKILRKTAQEEGFQEGLISLNEHLLKLDHELKEIRENIQKKILPLALKAAKKIMGEELRLHPDRIIDIVLTSLKQVTQHRQVTIFVNKQDLPRLEKAKAKFKKIFEALESFSIEERDDIEVGGCMIETEAGIINAQLENQWRAMEMAFQNFMSPS